MGVNSLPKTVTRQRRGNDLNSGPYALESSTLTTRLPSQYWYRVIKPQVLTNCAHFYRCDHRLSWSD